MKRWRQNRGFNITRDRQITVYQDARNTYHVITTSLTEYAGEEHDAVDGDEGDANGGVVERVWVRLQHHPLHRVIVDIRLVFRSAVVHRVRRAAPCLVSLRLAARGLSRHSDDCSGAGWVLGRT